MSVGLDIFSGIVFLLLGIKLFRVSFRGTESRPSYEVDGIFSKSVLPKELSPRELSSYRFVGSLCAGLGVLRLAVGFFKLYRG